MNWFRSYLAKVLSCLRLMQCPSCKNDTNICSDAYIRGFKSLKVRERFTTAQRKWGDRELYHCNVCGRVCYKVAFNRTVVAPIIILPEPDDFVIELRDKGDTAPADLKELLKLVPGQSVLSDVADKVGYPFATHTLQTGILLCYHSDDPNNPHSILIDELYKVVKLVAIHNDSEAFDLDNLKAAYGHQEFVTRTDGFEFWMYEAHGVAKVTEGFSDEAILFVQFFEKRLDMDRYMEMNCFFAETFMPNDSDWA